MNDAVVVFDAARRRDRFFLYAIDEVVGKVAAVFETVVSTSSYAVVIETGNEKVRLGSNFNGFKVLNSNSRKQRSFR